MFSKAKLKRFNEEVGCAPPPTAYDPKTEKKPGAVTILKADRWKDLNSQNVPGPGAYGSDISTSPVKKATAAASSSSHLNSSTCSNVSSNSGSSVFVVPRHLTRSTSARSHGSRGLEHSEKAASELQEQIRELTDERNSMRTTITELEQQLKKLQEMVAKEEAIPASVGMSERREDVQDSKGRHLRDSSTSPLKNNPQEDREAGVRGEEEANALREELRETQQAVSSLKDERSGLQLRLRQVEEELSMREEESSVKSMSEEDIQSLKENIDHLTLLRDNLEASLLVKDDLIAELQLQLDEVVAEGRSFQQHWEAARERTRYLEAELESSLRSNEEGEGKVRGLVARYEALVRQQVEERDLHREALVKKDIEIELLNDSLNNLNMKIAEYESTISSLQAEVSEQNSKISVLESTVSDLSLGRKEREMMESMLEEELNHRTGEVAKLEKTIGQVEVKLGEVREERGALLSTLEEEQRKTAQLSSRLHQLEVLIKEKEVVQQFLEKEITSREAEVSESSSKVKELEGELETVRQVALDLQQEAEAHLNQVLTLKATVSAKDYDIDAKSDLISSLQQEISQKVNETIVLQEKYEGQLSSTTKAEEDLGTKDTKIEQLVEELSSVKLTLAAREECIANLESKSSSQEENNQQLEEKVVELMAEISDREAQYLARFRSIESDLDDMGVKYSEALLEHEATRRVLAQASEELEKESLLRLAAERDLQSLKEEAAKYAEDKHAADSHMKDLVQKYTSLEDALACEEAENRDLEERLEREVNETACIKKELASAQTAIDGFCTQITQLKIDMRKKSQAVEEMHQCIEGLREERQHLTTLRDNLEAAAQAKEETIALLRLQASTTEREAEEDRVTFRSRIADLENHLKESQREVESCKEEVEAARGRYSELEERHAALEKSHEEKATQAAQLTASLKEREGQCESHLDQLRNLETSLLDKTAQLESHKEEVTNTLQTTTNKLRQEVDQANQTLASKSATLDALNATLDSKEEELQALQRTLGEKQSVLKCCKERLEELESSSERLSREKEEANQTISDLREALTSSQGILSRLEITFKEEREAEVLLITEKMETDMQSLKDENAVLREELEDWKGKFIHLEKIIEPFREQLDAYEVEKNALLEQNSAALGQVDKLSEQYTALLGHQNHKQKIHHVRQLKIENNQFREEVHKLRQEVERQRKTVRRLEEKLCRGNNGKSSSRLNDTSRLVKEDKENSLHTGPPRMASTPLGASNRPHRL